MCVVIQYYVLYALCIVHILHMVTYGTGWYGLGGHGMVQCQYGVAWNGIAWYDMAWSGLVWHGMVGVCVCARVCTYGRRYKCKYGCM